MPTPISAAAPSTIALLHECGYRVALRRGEHQGPKSSTPWARLGAASHAVLAAAISQELGEGGDDYGARFEGAWQRAITVQAEAASISATERLWGPPLRWPTYADRKLRTRRLAQKIAKDRSAWVDAELLVEQRLESTDGTIYGTPDVVVRRPSPHRVEDFKTGGVLDDDGALKDRYRRQILIYAHLERDVSGSLPQQGVVRPLRGEEMVFDIFSDAVEKELDEARDAIQEFNASLAHPEQLARPSAATCRTCPHTGRCEPFWTMIKDVPQAELGAVGGTVTSVHATDGHGIAVHMVADEGNAGVAELAVRGIPTPLAPWLPSLELGRRVRIVGLAVIGGTTASFAPHGLLRVNTSVDLPDLRPDPASSV